VSKPGRRWAAIAADAADRETPLKQVAFRLGLSHPESFHRAFKRWTGKTPISYRLRARA